MQARISQHLLNILVISIGYIISMILVKSVIVPAQQLYLPAVTTFAALIFPLHGVRVLSAWLFKKWSILYLFVANCVMHLVLTPGEDITTKSLCAWILVSTIAWISFEIFRLCGANLYREANPIVTSTWRNLFLIAFFSSILNSLGHNIIFAGDILPENSLNTMFAFMIGDTLGTFACFAILMLAFRFVRIIRR